MEDDGCYWLLLACASFLLTSIPGQPPKNIRLSSARCAPPWVAICGCIPQVFCTLILILHHTPSTWTWLHRVLRRRSKAGGRRDEGCHGLLVTWLSIMSWHVCCSLARV